MYVEAFTWGIVLAGWSLLLLLGLAGGDLMTLAQPGSASPTVPRAGRLRLTRGSHTPEPASASPDDAARHAPGSSSPPPTESGLHAVV
ncbi:MAG: hypothetical protein ACRDJN_24550 [Chloroflexota bacterium]